MQFTVINKCLLSKEIKYLNGNNLKNKIRLKMQNIYCLNNYESLNDLFKNLLIKSFHCTKVAQACFCVCSLTYLLYFSMSSR